MKKAKLLASIISLCFALAVLTFGVFAAQQVNYTISGSISYLVSDAYVNIQTKVYRSSVMPDNKQELAQYAQSFVSGTQATKFSGETLSQFNAGTINNFNSTTDEFTTPATNTFTATTGDGIALAFETVSEVQYWSYYIVMTVENLGDNNVYINPIVPTVKQSGTAKDPAEVNLVQYLSQGYSVVAKGSANKKTIVLAYTVSDPTLNISNITFDYSVQVNAGNYTNSNLIWDTSGFWYVNMGTRNTDYNVRWRLYSADGGGTKYPVTASATKPEYPLGQGIFILEDAVNVAVTDGIAAAVSNSNRTDVAKMDYATGSIGDSYLTTYLNIADLASDVIYQNITSVYTSTLCQDNVIGTGGGNNWSVENVTNLKNESYNSNSAVKLWQLSLKEILVLIGGGDSLWSGANSSAFSWYAKNSGTTAGYWTRTYDKSRSSYKFTIYNSTNNNSSTYVSRSDVAGFRPAFLLAL